MAHVFLAAVIIFVMIGLENVVLRGGFCLSCGGRGQHKHDCPLRDER